MSATVDERVVSMRFDNAQFEKGVQQTLNSLNNLNQTVEQAGRTHSGSFNTLITGLNGVQHSINSGIMPAMNAVTNKFSFLGTMTDQVIRNMTNSLTGLIHKGFSSIFQVTGGMNEYELKMGSIQTILNGTGESLEVVKDKLEELNTYSDQTIYSFKDMTDNIGKFTNQGVKLDDAVNAIKGIANEAALSGANAQQASHAMYNFSQALSSGYVKLIDWKSIENAQMATIGFKQTLLETATALGTVVKHGDKYITTTTNMQGKTSDLFNAQKGFNDSLSNQWMTADVLTQALEVYATDVTKLSDAEKEEYETKLKSKGFTEEQIKNFEELGTKASKAATEIKTFSMLVDTAMEAIGSGWAQTFELIFGDFNEAKALWTGINNTILDPMISKFSQIRNDALKLWKEQGGRTATLQTFVNLLNAIDSVLRPIREAFADVFGSLDGSVLANISKNLETFTYGLIGTNKEMQSLKEKATGVFRVLKFVLDVLIKFKRPLITIWAIAKAFAALKAVTAAGFGLAGLFGILKMIMFLGIAAYILKIKDHLSGIASIISKISSHPFFKTVKNFANLVIGTIVKGLGRIYQYLKDIGVFDKVVDRLKWLKDNILVIASNLRDLISKVDFSKITTAFSNLVPTIKTIVASIGNFFTKTESASKSVASSVENISTPLKSSIGLFDTLGASVDNFLGSFNMVAYAAEESEQPIYYVGEGLLQMAEATEEVVEPVEEASEEMADWQTQLSGLLDKIDDLVPAIKPMTDGIRDWLNNLNNLNPTVKKIIDVIGNFAAKLNWAKVIAFGVIVFYIQMMRKLNNSVNSVGATIDKFGKHFDNLFDGLNDKAKNCLDTIGGTFASITGYFNTLRNNIANSNFKNTAFGILALAGAFGILAVSMEYLDDDVLLNAVAALVVLSAAVLIINKSMAVMSKSVDPVGMAALAAGLVIFNLTLLTIAASMLAVGGVIAGLTKIMGSYDDALMAMLTTLSMFILIGATGITMLAVMAAVMASIGSIAPSIFLGAAAVGAMAAAMIAFNGALLLSAVALTALTPFIAAFVLGVKLIFTTISGALVNFINSIKTFEDVGNIFKNLVIGLATVMVGFVAFKVAVKLLKAIAIDLATTGVIMSVGIGTFAISIGALAAAIFMIIPAFAALGLAIVSAFTSIKLMVNGLINAIFNFKSIGDVVKTVAKIIAGFMLALPTLVITIGGVLVALFTLRTITKYIGTDMLKIAAGMLLLAAAIKIWSGIPFDNLANGFMAITGTMAGMALVLKMLDGVNIGKISAALLGLVVSLYMLTPLAALYGVAWPVIGKGMLVMAGGLIAIGAAIKLMSGADTKKMLGATIVLTMLVGAITYLATMLGAEFQDNAEGMTSALVSILAIVVVFGIIADHIAQMGNQVQSVAKLAGVVVLFGAVVAGMVVALSALVGFPADQLLSTAESLSLAMGAFAASMVFIGVAANLMKEANIGGMVAMMLAFSVAMEIMLSAMQNLQGLDTANIITFFVAAGAALLVLSIAAIGLGQAAEEAVVGIAIFLATILLVSVALMGAGLAFKLWGEGFNLILTAVNAFLPVFIQFLHGLADLANRTDDIIETCSAVTAFGKSLVDLALGMGAVALAGVGMAVALASTALGLTGFAVALTVTSAAVTMFAAAVSGGMILVEAALAPAGEWGTHLIQNFANGIINGLPNLVNALLDVGKTICNYLAHTNPIMGLLAGGVEQLWGVHLDQNFADGLISGIPFVSDAANSVAGGALDGLLSRAAEAVGIGNIYGQNFAKGMIDVVKSTLANIQSAMNKMNNLPVSNSRKAEYGKASTDFQKKVLESGKPTIGGNIKSKLDLANDAKKFNKEFSDVMETEASKNDTFDISNFLNMDGMNKTIEDAMKNLEVPDAGGGGGAGGGSGKGGGSGSGSAKEAEEAAKKAAEAEKQHKKYLDLTTKSALAYDGVYKNLNNTLDDTKPSENAQNAIKSLAEDLYKASLTGNETAEDLAKAAENTEKVFIDMYEGIKKKTKDSLDFFKDFDKGFSNIVKPKQIMKSITSQISGNVDMTKIWKELAMRGAPSKWLKDIIEKGAEALPEIRSVLQLSTDQWTKYFNAINQKENLSEFMANEAMASLALGRQVEKLKEASEVRKKYVEEGQKIINDWNSIENDGSLASQAAYDITAKRMEELAKKYGVSVEEIQKACKEVADGTVESVDKQLAAFDKLSIAYNKWQNSFETAKNAYISGMGDFLKSFDEFKINDDDEDALSVDKIKENLKKRKEAVEQFNEDINKLIEMGLNEEKLNELVAAGPESSYETVHALAEGTKEDIADINEYLEGAQADTNNAAIAYGQSMANSIVAGFDATLLPYFEALGTKFDLSALLQKAGIDMSVVGQQLGFGIKDGIDSATPEVESSTLDMSRGVDQKAQKYINKENGYSKAENFMIGILNGIEDYKEEVLSAIEEICSAVGDVPYDEWEEGSPSRLTRKYAKWFIEGMVGGFKYYGSNAVDAVKNDFVDPIVENMKSALGTAYDILTNDGDMSPTITPVLDLSNIESGRKTLGSLMSTNGLQVNASLGTVNTPASKIDKLVGALSGNNNAQNQTGNNFNFVQNNYSPKALSRLEIYRQTKNQFAQLKGMVN